MGSKVYERKEEGDKILIIADLTIGKGPFNDTYKSDVRFDKETDTIKVTNIEGPLTHLQNNWKFVEKNNMTEVYFDVDFEIKNKFLNMLMEKSFEYGLNKIADAFQKRGVLIAVTEPVPARDPCSVASCVSTCKAGFRF